MITKEFKSKINLIILFLSICGFLFAGYLSAYKFLNKVCALGESCPIFMGLPACYFGFAMYFTLTIFSAALVLKIINEKLALGIILIVSFLGILFSGYFTIRELPLLFENGIGAYVLGLPTCALGLMFYILIFTFALFKRFR